MFEKIQLLMFVTFVGQRWTFKCRKHTLQELSHDPFAYVDEWHTYFVNNYKFYTRAWSKRRKKDKQ